MAILKLQPCYKNYIWGGHKLVEDYNKNYQGDVLAESWELSCHVDGNSLIMQGEFVGKTLQEYIEWEGKKILGENCRKFKDFPVLIKLIDAKENLSIQVHPDDDYALQHEGQYGKTEMWYVADCDEDAYLYYGFSKKITKEELQKRICEQTLLEVLNKVYVKKGDVFFIEAGTVHAIGAGCVIAEIQQNSNVTYRVYDYGRKDKDGQERDLHIEKALQVADCDLKKRNKSFSPHLGSCEYFMVDKLVLDGEIMRSIKGNIDRESFLHILIIEGSAVIKGDTEIQANKGDSILLTAGSGKYEVVGKCEALLTRIPSCTYKERKNEAG